MSKVLKETWVTENIGTDYVPVTPPIDGIGANGFYSSCCFYIENQGENPLTGFKLLVSDRLADDGDLEVPATTPVDLYGGGGSFCARRTTSIHALPGGMAAVLALDLAPLPPWLRLYAKTGEDAPTTLRVTMTMRR